MKIQSMFRKDIDRPINGVIKVMQTDDENRKQELEEYVITRELRRHFGVFYDNYEKSIDGPTDKMGVWISGFFGSGKSHFLKILSYLLANDIVEGKHAIDYFEDKFDYDPYRFDMMKRISKTPTSVILFNIDAKSPMGKDQDAILRVFTKVFYEHCGYYPEIRRENEKRIQAHAYSLAKRKDPGECLSILNQTISCDRKHTDNIERYEVRPGEYEEYDWLALMLFWLPYRLRCHYFHSENTVPVFCYEDEKLLQGLAFVNELLEGFLSKELTTWVTREKRESLLVKHAQDTAAGMAFGN